MEKNSVITRSLLRAVKASDYKPSVVNSLIRHLNTLTTAQLTSFYLQNESLRFLLAEPYLDKFWHRRLTRLNPFDDDFRFCEQSPLCCREILLGYGCAMLKGATQNEWQQGLALKSFFCAQLLVNNHLSSIVSQESFDEQKAITLCELLESPEMQTTLHCHQAPGYLLAANTYFSLFARCTEAALYNGYLLKTFEYLERAQQLQNQSLQAIHNDYLGEGIQKSNSYGIETIAGMIQAIKSVTLNQKGSHSAIELETLYSQAKTLAEAPLSFKEPTLSNSCVVKKEEEVDKQQGDPEGNTALHLALLSHDFGHCKTLVSKDPKLKSSINAAGLTPLALAKEISLTLPNWVINMLNPSPSKSLEKRGNNLHHDGEFCQKILNNKTILRSNRWKAFYKKTETMPNANENARFEIDFL